MAWSMSGTWKRSQPPVSLAAHSREVRTLVVSKDGRLFASGSSDGGIKLWNLAERTERSLLLGPGGCVRALALSADDKLLAAAGGQGSVILWDLSKREERVTFARHGNLATGVAFTPDGRQLATVGWDRTVKFWDLNPATWVAPPTKAQGKK